MNFEKFKAQTLKTARMHNYTRFLELMTQCPEFSSRWNEIRNKNGDTLVHVAANFECLDIIKYFVANGNKVILESRNSEGKTPLHFAASFSRMRCLKYLLSCDVDVDALKRSDWTPLMLACTKTDLSIIQELIAHGAKLDFKNKDGWTAFHIAIRTGNAEIVEYFLGLDRDIWEPKTNNGRTCLHIACMHGHFRLVRRLLGISHRDKDVKNKSELTPLMEAVFTFHNDIVEYLVKKSADVFQRDIIGKNVLHIATTMANYECITFLVKHRRMSIDTLCFVGKTPLHYACEANNLKTVDMILRLGADYRIRDRKGLLAVKYAKDEKIYYRIMNPE